MRKQKNKFWNFVFSCMPGAGHMYLGFMRQGVSLMLLFFGIIGLAAWLNFDILLYLLPILWFYSFFDSLNKNSLLPEVFDKLEDEFIWGKDIDIDFINKRAVRGICSFFLIIVGLIMLINNTWSILAYCINDELYWLIEYVINRSYQIIFAVVIIGLGIRLIIGKKKEIAKRDEKADSPYKKNDNADMANIFCKNDEESLSESSLNEKGES